MTFQLKLRGVSKVTARLGNVEKNVIRNVRKEVKRQTLDGTRWLREDVLQQQRYVGYANFPDVKESTKKAKIRAGEEKVLIRKGHLLRSIDHRFEKGGMVGVITGGTDYYKHLRKKWDLERLFMTIRGPRVKKALKQAMRRGVRK